ncbi:MAG: hypothetical protein K2K05_05610, partial [Muribaculaceae bacterium]|nr:hypothetical protein [Muribaculaceae bacterium]
LKAFLDNWKIVKENLSVSSASDIDAVKVMTIHKSKGLEFDCVHIPFGSRELIGKTRGQWIPFPDIPGVDKALCPPMIYIEMEKWFSMPGSMLYDRYSRYLKESIEDTMNKTYVAFTRASEQLTVYYNNGRGIGSNIADAMMAGYDGDDEWLTDISKYYGKDGEFRMGEILTKAEAKPSGGEEKDKDATMEIHLDEYVVTRNEEAQVITRVSDVLDFTPDPGDDSAFGDDDDTGGDYADEEARLRGVMLHDVLSRIITLSDIAPAVTAYSAQHGLTAAEKRELMSTMTHLLDCAFPHMQRWFAANDRAVNEQAVYDPESGTMKRIDRLVFLPGGRVEVIDYKFTSEPTPAHRRQVGEYMRLLHKMGYSDVGGYLWYPFRGEILEVEQRR